MQVLSPDEVGFFEQYFKSRSKAAVGLGNSVVILCKSSVYITRDPHISDLLFSRIIVIVIVIAIVIVIVTVLLINYGVLSASDCNCNCDCNCDCNCFTM